MCQARGSGGNVLFSTALLGNAYSGRQLGGFVLERVPPPSISLRWERSGRQKLGTQRVRAGQGMFAPEHSVSASEHSVFEPKQDVSAPRHNLSASKTRRVGARTRRFRARTQHVGARTRRVGPRTQRVGARTQHVGARTQRVAGGTTVLLPERKRRETTPLTAPGRPC